MSTEDAPIPRAIALDRPAHVLVVRAPYYRAVVDGLHAGACAILAEAGCTHETLDVAGAFELPQAIRLVLRGPARFDGFVALGCVVKGETDHYDYLCRATMSGLMDVALQFGIALGAGLLTVHDVAQAVARAGQDWQHEGGHNKGAEAAAACVAQIAAARRFGAA